MWSSAQSTHGLSVVMLAEGGGMFNGHEGQGVVTTGMDLAGPIRSEQGSARVADSRVKAGPVCILESARSLAGVSIGEWSGSHLGAIPSWSRSR